MGHLKLKFRVEYLRVNEIFCETVLPVHKGPRQCTEQVIGADNLVRLSLIEDNQYNGIFLLSISPALLAEGK